MRDSRMQVRGVRLAAVRGKTRDASVLEVAKALGPTSHLVIVVFTGLGIPEDVRSVMATTVDHFAETD